VTSSRLTISELRQLSAVERAEELESVVVAEFKAALLMSDDEELPFDCSFFDLGLTSLGLTDLKQRLERFLGCEIDANVLFNSPTVERLLAHLAEHVLAGPALTDLYEQR